jgi:hypothetical protein
MLDTTRASEVVSEERGPGSLESCEAFEEGEEEEEEED